MKGLNKERMSSYNRIAVMRAFYHQELITIQSLAYSMQLAIPTISNIIKELADQKYIRQADCKRTSRGRHRGYWTLNQKKEHFISMEVSPYEIKGLVVDISGTPQSHIMRIQHKFKTIDELTDTCAQLIIQLKESFSFPIHRCALGIHGIVNYDEGVSIFLPHINEKREVAFCDILEKETNCKVRIDNDCNTKALAEKWFGLGQNIDNFIWLNLDYGIGAALVLSGELFRGNKFTAGQIGHVSFSSHGSLCRCGNRGCLETYFSSHVLLSKFRLAWENASFEQSPSPLTLNEFFTALDAHNPIALSVFEESAKYLGKALIALTNIVSPEHIFLGGKLCLIGLPLLEYLQNHLKENSIYRRHDLQELSFSLLSEEQLIAGASFLWLEEDLSLIK